jgi:hypothetical protein
MWYSNLAQGHHGAKKTRSLVEGDWAKNKCDVMLFLFLALCCKILVVSESKTSLGILKCHVPKHKAGLRSHIQQMRENEQIMGQLMGLKAHA